MILIFDTYAGLCNQFYDIQCAINFCLINKIFFSFRFASFRNSDLVSWFDVPFSELFDPSFLKKYFYYIDYDQIKYKINNENSFNNDNTVCCNQFLSRENLVEQLFNLNKKYIILKQFWDIYLFKQIIEDVNTILIPSTKIMNKYIDIKNELSLENNNYNFIHYRYEHDFINHFKLSNMKNLKDIIMENYFKNKDLRIYIATTNLENIIQKDEFAKNKIIYKNEHFLEDLNFEEKAFIDYMIGLNSMEVIGHSNSSFSTMLNNLKRTNHYYN